MSMVQSEAIVIREEQPSSLATRPLEQVLELRRKVVQLMSTAMKENVDYGTIPGCEKHSLWQPGAQKIFSLFQLDCKLERQPDSVIQQNPPFILHSYLARAIHIPTGVEVSQGVGSCNSGEEKYGWRRRKRKCPKCGKTTILKGKEEYGGGWICWLKPGKSDGCGAKFPQGDPSIESQLEGRVANENIWEQENTIRKMAAKRAEVHLALNLGLSDIFTQDVEDMAEFGFEQSDAQEKVEAHREKHEHFSTLCKICLDLGVPEGERVILIEEHLYLRSLGIDHGPEFGTLKYCPGCKKRHQDSTQPAPAQPEPNAGQETVVPAMAPPEPKPAQRITKNFEFLKECGTYKKLLGDGIYYGILKKIAEVNKANEITEREKQIAVFRAFVAAAKKSPSPQSSAGVVHPRADQAQAAAPQIETLAKTVPSQPEPVIDQFTDRITLESDRIGEPFDRIDRYVRRDNATPQDIELRIRAMQDLPPDKVKDTIEKTLRGKLF